MPGKFTDINLRRILTHLQLPPHDSQSRITVALDIENAFDSVSWQYMSVVLQLVGLGLLFCRWINLLYKSPEAQSKLWGMQYSAFPVQRGTCQGCPLSPALFSLVMSPSPLPYNSWMLYVAFVGP